MPIDPAPGLTVNPERRQADKLADLERRVRLLEQATPRIQTGSAAPAAEARDGTPYGRDNGTGEFWLRIGAAWRKVNLA